MINRQRIWALMRKDWRELARNKQAMIALVILPVVFAAILPAVIILPVKNSGPSALQKMQGLLDNLPGGAVPAGFSPTQTMVYASVVYILTPFFLLIPVIIAALTASSCFVGEKERRTIEGLLYTPITDRELVLAKALGSVIPSVLITWATFLLYTVLVNALGAPLLGGLFFPTWTWAVIMLSTVPLVAFLATCIIVAASGRARTMQDAQGAAVLIMLPVIIALFAAQSSGKLLLHVPNALLGSAILLVIDVALFKVVVGRFQRERIVTRL